MIAPFHLRKTTEPGAVAGLLLSGARAADLLALYAAVGSDPPPTVYAVPGGFLLKLTKPPAAAFPHTVRLRALAPDLFVPVDAELLPRLLPDEAAVLVRERGLVFLPGGKVLGYPVNRPVRPSDLLIVERRRTHPWKSLPARPARAERLREVLLDIPLAAPEDVLDSGDIGVEDPRPPDADALSKTAGAASMNAGQSLMWLGKVLGWNRLSQLGADLMESAIEMAPRLTESVIGKQEAALRELLRQFREGDLDSALRRALPLGGPGGRGGKVATDARLPTNNPFYSLGDLMGGGKGRASVWLGGGDVQAQLAAEYRKAAEAAVAKGDFRRAAFIYGKLLRDYRSAAAVLSRGGMHHDAAILYLEKLGDGLSAAKAFEAAGEIDRAVQLYRERGEHVLAGDALRKAGEDEAALHEYRQAADKLATAQRNYLAAGELILSRAGRADVALEYFTAGWAQRPEPGAFPCLLRLTRLHAEAGPPGPVLKLLDEADLFFLPPGNDHHAATFYNEVARLAGRGNLAAVCEDLRDRALRGAAHKLRQRAAVETRPGAEPSALLGQSGEWMPSVVSDAAFAFREGVRRSRAAGTVRTLERTARVRLGRGPVVAACAAPQSGDLFVGYASGAVVRFQPRTGATHGLPLHILPPSALATDEAGGCLVSLRTQDDQSGVLTYYCRTDSGYIVESVREAVLSGEGILTPVKGGGEALVGFWNGASLFVYLGPTLLPLGEEELPFPPDHFRGALLLRGFDPEWPDPAVMLFDGDSVWTRRPRGGPDKGEEGPHVCYRYGWQAAPPQGCDLRRAPLSWLQPTASSLELAGVDAEGAVRWASMQLRTSGLKSLVETSPGGYRAAALVSAGRVAAVGRSGVHWLRAGDRRFTIYGSTRADLGDAVACFPSPLTNELLVVCAEGDLVRVPLPNG